MRILLIILGSIFLATSCTKTNNCSTNVLIVNNLEAASSNGINIRSVEIAEGCINFKLSIGGCDNDHEIDLLTTGNYTEPGTIGITLAFKDNNPQTCKALFYKNYNYSLSVIDDIMGDNNQAVLYFRESDVSIIYNR